MAERYMDIWRYAVAALRCCYAMLRGALRVMRHVIGLMLRDVTMRYYYVIAHMSIIKSASDIVARGAACVLPYDIAEDCHAAA